MTSTDIYNIFSIRPHNVHYLNRYINFIKYRNNTRDLEYKEHHHIIPVSEYPEYAKNKWNILY